MKRPEITNYFNHKDTVENTPRVVLNNRWFEYTHQLNKYIDYLESQQKESKQIPLLVSDEDIDKKIAESRLEVKRIDENLKHFNRSHERESAFMLLGRHEGIIIACKWLKSQIKGIPKELSQEDVMKIFSDPENEYLGTMLYKEEFIMCYKAVVKHFSKRKELEKS